LVCKQDTAVALTPTVPLTTTLTRRANGSQKCTIKKLTDARNTALFLTKNDAGYILEPLAEALLEAEADDQVTLAALRKAAERSLQLSADDNNVKLATSKASFP
jgi:hypothetical protein